VRKYHRSYRIRSTRRNRWVREKKGDNMPHEHKGDTLEDIQQKDIDNVEYVLKHAKNYTFSSVSECLGFANKALTQTLLKHGIDITEFLNNPTAMDPVLEEKGIKVEHRDYTEEADRHRSGLYVYKTVDGNSEIVAFIGKPGPGRIAGSWYVNSSVVI
jgi:hypothetical protein